MNKIKSKVKGLVVAIDCPGHRGTTDSNELPSKQK